MSTSLFPTHKHSLEFWEYLGRTIATYGFLEEVLDKAIFAFTATREYNPNEIEEVYKTWFATLERALTGQLCNLAEKCGRVVKDNPKATNESVDELVDQVREAAAIRNVLCHGSWRAPDTEGKSRPLYVNRQLEVFETDIDIDFLNQVQSHVAELACVIIQSVKQMGYQFTGTKGEMKNIV